MFHPKFTSRGEHAKGMLSRSGYAKGGKVAAAGKGLGAVTDKEAKALAASIPKKASGGAVEGFASGGRLDKSSRSKKPQTKITIINAPMQASPQPPMPPLPMGGPPMPPPGPGPMMPPPGGGGGLPMLKTGGKVPHFTAGAGSGEGRLQKAESMSGMKRTRKGAY